MALEVTSQEFGGRKVEDKSEWRAKLALACYVALVGAVLLGSIVGAFILYGMGVDVFDPPFPSALISIPVNETIILGVTLLFAKYKGAGLRELGLKKASFVILLAASVAAVPLLLLADSIYAGEQMIFGPDPTADLVERAVAPRSSFQLVIMIFFALVLVGPCEELAFRGFVQKGFENSFGRMNGLLIASGLFGLLHGLNTLYAIVPVFVASLVLGYVWQRTDGNTLASALMHGVYDAIALAAAYFLAA